MFTIETKAVTDKLRSQYKQLSERAVRTGIARAINHTLGKTKTASSREIRSVYRIKAKDITKSMRITRAYVQRQFGELVASGQPLSAMAFGARQTKKGVSINVKGQRKLIRGAFLATMKSGKQGVFARGRYGKDGFEFRTKRIRKKGNDLPIEELKTIAVPQALAHNAVLNNLGKKMEADYPGRLQHELKYLASKI
ncbi:MAG: phage tail protein [Flavobacteriales bacterium]|jgi:hypothetical protein